MQTEQFADGLGTLADLAEQRRTAIMCSERLPWRCHRRFIASALEAGGWRVIHIIDHDRAVEPHERP
jgi:uncharacterized protein (DUF488 family)